MIASMDASAGPFEQVDFEPTRAAGLQRLAAFAPKTGRFYANQRNYDRGASDRGNVSALSPWLRRRAVLEEEVLQATLSENAPATAEKFIQEVFWRGYFKGWLEHRPDVWRRYRDAVDELAVRLDDDRSLRKRYDKAVGGATGIDCLDAWSHELVETGYLHNHARMWFASIWIFTLQLPWELGADFFFRHLLDGDPASNTCSWRWVAGLHTQGKTYLARPDNIRRYTEGRFDGSGALVDEAPTLEEAPLDPPRKPAFFGPDKPAGPAGVIVTEEDCHPESLSVAGDIKGGLFLTAATPRSPMETGAQSQTFASALVKDAAARARSIFSGPCDVSDNSNWGAEIVGWARKLDVGAMVVAHPPVGPVADRLREAITAARESGVEVTMISRKYDKAVWPHASKGFFGLKKKIPEVLDALHLT